MANNDGWDGVESFEQITARWRAEGRTFTRMDVAKEQHRQQIRQTEDRVLALEATLGDRDDRAARHVREVAQSIRDHRTIEERRQRRAAGGGR